MNKLFQIAAISLAAAAMQAPAAAQQDEVCRNCGVVESVTPVTRTTQPKGIAGTPVTPGMAVGGLVGGVVGNQVGNGKAGGTLLGAAGGAYLGHSIEKKKYTTYRMHVRMQDGTMRTVEQRTALARGSHVFVEGKTARLQQATHQRQG